MVISNKWIAYDPDILVRSVTAAACGMQLAYSRRFVRLHNPVAEFYIHMCL
jgi:hypothetical protein